MGSFELLHMLDLYALDSLLAITLILIKGCVAAVVIILPLAFESYML